ncbi:MAG: hypothetical protein A2847_03055 [Candidatus Sungbacteria bacterium RIFCSPHIGHO2_01_FULL_50_25]|uniref:Uncharacterized protein n=1 Tax=Candidatus Sungbacteria bacterium RIFCSPHIGHO2_01_FULL_50_25 TaxID=1802265 RepID=A0A1G2K6G6_9BACT|nr:MAG: hypothetical protein A2847_03055 [Candidatus Sungbacteria bacterium RIFCSPHIGHO2_01_FULL_50_25]
MQEANTSGVTYIGKCNFRGNERIFGIKQKDRRQHMYVIGKTGVGKTALLKNMALQDIRSGRGICIIDPHGEFIEEVLTQIPAERVNDVIYFNPVDSEYPMGFNVLETSDPKYKHLIVSDLMGIFTKIWANVWSARMEYILQNCVNALLDTPGTTLLGIPRILVDKDYREKIVANVKDPVVKSFWVHEYETWRDQFRNEAIVPIQNKVGQFLNTSFIRNIVGQSKSTLNISEIMNDGKILLVNVSKGRIGEDNSALLGAMIITKVQLAAMERVRVPEEDRKDFYLYVDEFQNFATDSFASILSEARKYRLNLILAHQYIGQLVTDVSTKVRDAVFGNVGTMISFRVGATDAEFLEQEFTPEFMQEDLINLPNHHIYLKLMVEGITSRPFSSVTLPPFEYERAHDVKEKVIRVARERYARPRAEVEDKIFRWSGGGSDDGDEGGGKSAMGDGKLQESICWNCGKTATVPFKPDGRRPVYCLSCLKQIEEGKLIPLPDRMPKVGKARFDDSLSTMGIEFSLNRGNAPSQSRSQREGGASAPVREQHSGGGRRDFRPRGDTRMVARHSRGDRRGGEGRVRTEPVVRGGGDGDKRISLSELRARPEEKKSDLRDRAREHRPADTSGLRKALEGLLKQEPQKEVEMSVASPQIESRPVVSQPLVSRPVEQPRAPIQSSATAPEQKKIQPGEAVKL